MNILINCSNLKKGGGLQVADSICTNLNRHQEHKFIVVISYFLIGIKRKIEEFQNVSIIKYDITNSFSTLFRGRDMFLDGLVLSHSIDCVITIFGPSRWNPKCKHICGFARSHLVLNNSPYYKRMSLLNFLKEKTMNAIVNHAFKRSTKYFYTENPYITELLKKKWPKYTIYTITNYYHQVYDSPELWKERKLADFNGVRLLCITANYSHKNLPIAIEIARQIKQRQSGLQFKFVFTVAEDQLSIPDDLRGNFELIGRVGIEECPSLYKQADIMFQPSLLECFSATYVEAMKMDLPIVTTDLEFAHGLCRDAAIYYDALSCEAAADAILRVINDKELQTSLIEAGKKQLKSFDNSEQRVDKLIHICEMINN
jgi:glycosyltransferase involved in cell wall biosynthesis